MDWGCLNSSITRNQVSKASIRGFRDQKVDKITEITWYIRRVVGKQVYRLLQHDGGIGTASK
jgi:hypothetical protein